MFARAALVGLLAVGAVRADAFDRYTNPVLAEAPKADGVKELTELTADLVTSHDQVLPGVTGAVVVVRTNDDRWAKLLVSAARQKVTVGPPGSDPVVVPMLRIERFVTYREATEREVRAAGQSLSLFPGFRLHLDLGQVVPEKLGGDLVATEPKPLQIAVRPLGNAKLYLLTKPMPQAAAKKAGKFEMSEKIEPKLFAGTFKLYDDGRRSGVLVLAVEDNGQVSGSLTSDKDGRKYEVSGEVGGPAHRIRFTVKFPQTEQLFDGYLFTGDGKAIAGTSKLQGRDAGFYAVRTEE